MSKNVVFLLLICMVFIPNAVFAQQRIPLRDAILRKIVTAQFKGLGGFNNKILEIEVVNQSKKTVEIDLNSGELFRPDNPGQQTLLLAETVTMTIAPQKKTQKVVYAFCAAHHKGAPSSGMKFTATGRASKNLCDLMQLVETKKYYDYAAQEAVWCLTDNGDIQWLMAENQQEEKDLREFVAAVKGIDLSKLPKVKRTKYVYEFVGRQAKRPALDIDYTDRTGGEKGKKIEQAQKKRDDEDEKAYKEAKEMEKWELSEIKGTLSVNVVKPSKIRIVIVSPKGEQLAEVYKSDDVVAGKGKFPYKFQEYNLPRGIYKIQVLDDTAAVIYSQDYELK